MQRFTIIKFPSILATRGDFFAYAYGDDFFSALKTVLPVFVKVGNSTAELNGEIYRSAK